MIDYEALKSLRSMHSDNQIKHYCFLFWKKKKLSNIIGMEKLCFENKSFKNFTYDLITSITLHMHLLRHNKKNKKLPNNALQSH